MEKETLNQLNYNIKINTTIEGNKVTITKREILKLGELAKIRISENEVEELQKQLNKILRFVDKINDHSLGEKHGSPAFNKFHKNRLRPDKITEHLNGLNISKNSPHSSESLITVPLVIE